jgi:hypothetical protein
MPTAAAAANDAEVLAGVVPPPMQTQIQRMGGMSSAVIDRLCAHGPAVHELVAKFADIPDRQPPPSRQGNGEGARAAAQRGHSIPEAPHTTAVGHRGMARLP